MARPDESNAETGIAARRNSLEQPPERLSRGGRGPVVVGTAIAFVLTVAVWQPWAQNGAQPSSPTPPQAAIPTAPASGGLPSGSTASSAPVRPAPTVATTAAPGTTRAAFYTTVTDNEWTVVALLAPAAPASTEEPATQHPVPAWSAEGPFLVLQQGLTPVAVPFVASSTTQSPCPPVGLPRDRTAVALPAGRVAYLGITVPSGVPRPRVSAARLGRSAGALARVPAPTVRLAGMDAATQYTIPTAGPGAVVLFAADPRLAIAPGAYQFTVASPGAAGDRYLYACIAP